MICVSEVILFSCPIIILICIKNPSLFDLCINISNKFILVCSCIAILCFYCFYVFCMFHCYCFDMYIDVHLSHLNKDYLLTYSLNLCICLTLQITTAQEDRRDEEKLYHKISLSELQTASPFVSINCALNRFSTVVVHSLSSL